MADEALDTTLEIDEPDLAACSQAVRERFERLPTKVNLFRMLAHSQGGFVPLMDLTDAVFKRLSLKDAHRELLVLLVAAHERTDYEWDQHVVISQAAGVSKDQILAIAAGRLDDERLFDPVELVLLRLGQAVLAQGAAGPVLVKQVLAHQSVEQLADAILTVGFYRMLAGFLKTFRIPSDAQGDGSWIKR